MNVRNGSGKKLSLSVGMCTVLLSCFVAKIAIVPGTIDANDDYHPTFFWRDVGYGDIYSDRHKI